MHQTAPDHRLNRKRHAHTQAAAFKKLHEKLSIGMTLSNAAEDAWAIFLEDASSPGKFRYQCFDATGFSSHHTYNTLDEAFKDAFICGYRVEDNSGVLDRLSKTAEWSHGMTIQAIRDKYNSGLIDWSEMLEMIGEVE